MLNFFTENAITKLKFIDIVGSTLLYVFFYFKIDFYNISADGAAVLKTFRSIGSFQAFKAGNLVVILENAFINVSGAQFLLQDSTVFRKNDPFSTEVENVQDQTDSHLIHVDNTFEIHDEHILVRCNQSKLHIMNLNDTSRLISDPV